MFIISINCFLIYCFVSVEVHVLLGLFLFSFVLFSRAKCIHRF